MTDPSQPLREEDVDPDPVRQFAKWFEEAASAGVSQPEAVALATATTDGAPSVRMVLVKQADHDGFVFFTNYDSRKGGELAANPRAALLFHWEPFGRQVRIEGPVVRTTPRGVRGVRPQPRARKPAQRGRLASEPDGREPGDARTTGGRNSTSNTPAPRCPSPTIGAGFASYPRRSSSGSTGATGCTTAFATAGATERGWEIDRLAP